MMRVYRTKSGVEHERKDVPACKAIKDFWRDNSHRIKVESGEIQLEERGVLPL